MTADSTAQAGSADSLKRRAIGDLLFALLICWSVAATAVVTRANLSRGPRATPLDGPRSLSPHDVEVAARRGFSRGPINARRTIVVFSDFQCPYCRRFAFVLDSFAEQHHDVRIVERHFPLIEIHDNAYAAALAAECASMHGRYAEVRLNMYSKRQLVDDENWGLIGRNAGIADTADFVSCVESSRYRSSVDADIADGQEIGVRGTPGVVVGRNLYAGALTLNDLERAIEK